jgi:predicted metal-binding protein
MTTQREIAEQLVEQFVTGRLYCDRCNSYDHECGCNPDVLYRHRAKADDAIESALQAERRRAIGALEAARAALRTACAYNHTCDLGGSCAICDQGNHAIELINALLSPPSPPAETNDD